jgi:hypothetical protein
MLVHARGQLTLILCFMMFDSEPHHCTAITMSSSTVMQWLKKRAGIELPAGNIVFNSPYTRTSKLMQLLY